MQLLTFANNFRLTSVAEPSHVQLRRFTLPWYPVLARWRIDTMPAGILAAAYTGIDVYQRGIGGILASGNGVTLADISLRVWHNVTSLALDNDVTTDLGPWDATVLFDPNGASLTGVLAGRLEVAYWQ